MSTSGKAASGSSLPDPVTIAHGGTGLTTPGTAWQALASDGTLDVWKGRSRVLAAFPRQSAVGSITTSASLIGGFATGLLALNELALGDVLHLRAGVQLLNNSGGNANMAVQTQIRATSAGTLASTVTISVASVATLREIYYDLWLTPRTLTAGGVVLLDGSFLSNFSATNATALVVANSTAQSIVGVGCPNTVINGPYDFDLQVVTNVNNAATTGQCMSFMIEKLTL